MSLTNMLYNIAKKASPYPQNNYTPPKQQTRIFNCKPIPYNPHPKYIPPKKSFYPHYDSGGIRRNTNLYRNGQTHQRNQQRIAISKKREESFQKISKRKP